MVAVHITKDFKNIDINPHKLKKLAETICSRFAERGAQDTKYEISIAIVDDVQIRKINKQFLNRNRPTDCLSFDLSDSSNRQSESRNRKSFELVVNAEMAVREANLRGHSSEAELALYVAHGLLHNFGFDDSTQKQAKTMRKTEDEILKQLGYGSVHNTKIC